MKKKYISTVTKKYMYFNGDIRRHLMVTWEDRRHRVDRSYNALGTPFALQIFFWKRKYNQTNVACMYTSFEWENTPCLADCLFLLHFVFFRPFEVQTPQILISSHTALIQPL